MTPNQPQPQPHDTALPGRGRYDWDLAAAMLARGSGVANAARVVGCHRTTLWRALQRSESFRRRVAELRADHVDEADAALEQLRHEVVQGIRREVALGNVRVLLWLADRLGLASPGYLGLAARGAADARVPAPAGDAAGTVGVGPLPADPAPPAAAPPTDEAQSPQPAHPATPPATPPAAADEAAPAPNPPLPTNVLPPDTPPAEMQAALSRALAEVRAVLATAGPGHHAGARSARRPDLWPDQWPGLADATAGAPDADVAPRRNGQSFQPLAAQRAGCDRDAGAVHALR